MAKEIFLHNTSATDFENLQPNQSEILFLSISFLQLRAAVFNPEKDISKLLTLIKGLGRLTFL